jgi:hypothetical protein
MQLETLSQERGDAWHRSGSTALLIVPSAIVPLPNAPDRNVVINHMHPASASITIRTVVEFRLDPRLL